MTRRITRAAIGAALGIALIASPVAAGNPSGRGQPNASCEETSSAPNGFSSGGFAKAELHYAGNGAGSLNANSGPCRVELATAEWVHFWNTRRLHSACGDFPPAEFEAAYHQRLSATTESA